LQTSSQWLQHRHTLEHSEPPRIDCLNDLGKFLGTLRPGWCLAGADC